MALQGQKVINYHWRKKKAFKMACGEFEENKKIFFPLLKSKIKGFERSKGNYHWRREKGFKMDCKSLGETGKNKRLELSQGRKKKGARCYFILEFFQYCPS